MEFAMITGMFNKFYCLLKGHNLAKAGKCPYTGYSYMVCTKCLKQIAYVESDLLASDTENGKIE